MILYLFFAILWMKNRLLLRYWVMVEPLASFFKGQQQSGRKSFSGMYTSTMRTIFRRLDALYKRCKPTFDAKLVSTWRCHGAFDNHNKITRKKTQTSGKSAIAHIGTATYLKEDVPFALPFGTKMMSPLGILLIVLACIEHSDTTFHIKGCVVPDYRDARLNMGVPVSPEYAYEQQRILDGFLHPQIGWKVSFVPGILRMPPMEYRKQTVPPPFTAYVDRQAGDVGLLFNDRHERGLCTHSDANAVSFTTERMHNIQCNAECIVGLNTKMIHLERPGISTMNTVIPTDQEKPEKRQKQGHKHTKRYCATKAAAADKQFLNNYQQKHGTNNCIHLPTPIKRLNMMTATATSTVTATVIRGVDTIMD